MGPPDRADDPAPAPQAGGRREGERALEGLNAAQRAAVTSTERALLVRAGPGTGKTRVLVARAGWLVATGAAPEQVMAVTFTNKAAEEMRARLEVLLGPERARRVALGTFHALCARILRAHPEQVGRSTRFAVYDRDDQLRALRRAVAACGGADAPAGELAAQISRAKGRLADPDEYRAFAASERQRALARVWEAYERELAASDALDFEDLVTRAVWLLERHPRLLALQRARRRHVMVDEYQDTDRAQLRFLGLVATGGSALFAVGDPDQAIYGFRGADLRGMTEVGRLFPGARAHSLTDSYRSTAEILAGAETLLGTAAPGRPRLAARRGSGAPVEVRWLGSAAEEAQGVAERIGSLAAAGRGLDQIAVLYRSRGVLGDLEPALAGAGVAYRVLGGVGLFGLAVVRDALAYLRLAANPHDREAFVRAVGAPRRGIGTSVGGVLAHAERAGIAVVEAARQAEGLEGLRAPARRALAALGDQLAGLAAAAAAGVAPSELLTRALLLPGGLVEHLRVRGARGDPEAERALTRLRELHRALVAWERREAEPTLWGWLAEASLAGAGEEATGAQRVSLATVHAAKGLEWPVVFLVGLEEGTFPSFHARTQNERAEERRLAYVALTRARDLAIASGAAERHGRARSRSPYLVELQALAAAWDVPAAAA